MVRNAKFSFGHTGYPACYLSHDIQLSCCPAEFDGSELTSVCNNCSVLHYRSYFGVAMLEMVKDIQHHQIFPELPFSKVNPTMAKKNQDPISLLIKDLEKKTGGTFGSGI